MPPSKKQICITADLDGLLSAAEQILEESPTKRPIIEGLRVRKKWDIIQDDYALMRYMGIAGDDAIRCLSERYFYSEKTIESIIYTR